MNDPQQPTGTDKETFTLTPKGFLAVKLINKLTKEEVCTLWDELTEMVREGAARNGMTEGVPCLVMHEGGHCITAERGPAPQPAEA